MGIVAYASGFAASLFDGDGDGDVRVILALRLLSSKDVARSRVADLCQAALHRYQQMCHARVSRSLRTKFILQKALKYQQRCEEKQRRT
jgi:hypothetical protein